MKKNVFIEIRNRFSHFLLILSHHFGRFVFVFQYFILVVSYANFSISLFKYIIYWDLQIYLDWLPFRLNQDFKIF